MAGDTPKRPQKIGKVPNIRDHVDDGLEEAFRARTISPIPNSRRPRLKHESAGVTFLAGRRFYPEYADNADDS